MPECGCGGWGGDFLSQGSEVSFLWQTRPSPIHQLAALAGGLRMWGVLGGWEGWAQGASREQDGAGTAGSQVRGIGLGGRSGAFRWRLLMRVWGDDGGLDASLFSGFHLKVLALSYPGGWDPLSHSWIQVMEGRGSPPSVGRRVGGQGMHS